MNEHFTAIYNKTYAEDEPLDAFLFHADEQLNGISLCDKTILEVGCGNGAFSLYMALCGKAEKVIALDEADGNGSKPEAFRQLKMVIDKHAIPNITTVKASLYGCELPENSFDVIVGNFSLHHAINPFGALFKDRGARQAALSTFKLFHTLLKDSGRIVLREMSRINFWRYMPYKWKMSHIDWKGHATLREWRWIIKKAGFCDVRHAFLTPFSLRTWPSPIIRSQFANFFFSSSFYLYAKKRPQNHKT
jgi:SAM-dependent methyltransferase